MLGLFFTFGFISIVIISISVLVITLIIFIILATQHLYQLVGGILHIDTLRLQSLSSLHTQHLAQTHRQIAKYSILTTNSITATHIINIKRL